MAGFSALAHAQRWHLSHLGRSSQLAPFLLHVGCPAWGNTLLPAALPCHLLRLRLHPAALRLRVRTRHLRCYCAAQLPAATPA